MQATAIIVYGQEMALPLIEAYNSVSHHDIFAVSETMLASSITNEDISIQGFSKDILCSDHPRNNKVGGDRLYYREGLPIKRKKDLEFIQGIVSVEITIARKKLLFSTVYRSPSQTTEQFENFIDTS